MTEIKIRYTWRRKSDGAIDQEKITLSQLEGEGSRPYILTRIWSDSWEIIGRDLYIGKQDDYGNDIYANDIVSYLCKTGLSKGSRYKGLVNQKEAEWFCGDDRFVDDGDEQVVEVSDHKVIGSIYTTPELLNSKQ